MTARGLLGSGAVKGDRKEGKGEVAL